jgi:Protein of unknown function (DUF4043)
LATTDLLTMDVVDSLRALLDSMPLPPAPVIFDGDKMGADSPLRVLLVSADSYNSFVKQTNFRQFQSNAMARAQLAGNHPLFMGEAGLWNGILIVKMPKPIRFMAGDTIKWCQDTATEVETITDKAPAALGATFAIDRSILLGGQAIAQAFGKNRMTGNPFFWSEKELDHGDKLEVLIGMMSGTSKIRFEIDYGDTTQVTDNGILILDSVVNLPGV